MKPKTCHRCDAPFSLFRRSRVTPEEGLCREHGWMSVEQKPKLGRRGFLLLGLGVVAAAVMPAPIVNESQALIIHVQFTGTLADGHWGWASQGASAEQLTSFVEAFHKAQAEGNRTLWLK